PAEGKCCGAADAVSCPGDQRNLAGKIQIHDVPPLVRSSFRAWASPLPSPRLRGEVGRRAQRGFRVRGKLVLPIYRQFAVSKTPLTPTLSPQTGRGRITRF